MSRSVRVLPIVYFVIAVFAVFMTGYRVMEGMWIRALIMAAAALFCAYRFHQLRHEPSA